MKNHRPIILFDGICNLCNGSVDFILKRDKKKQFQFLPMQSVKGVEILKKYGLPKETDSVILIKDDTVYFESEAIFEITSYLNFPWNWAVIFKAIPGKWRNMLYRWIALNRYKWFGKRKSCRIIEETVVN